MRGPRNHFALAPAKSYLFVAGGIGITPILPMLAAAEAEGAQWRLVYGGRTRASMAFRAELTELYGERVDVRPQDETGLLDLAGLLGIADSETLVYCCGPEPLLGAVEAACGHWPSGALHVERFAPKKIAEPVRQESFEVELAESGMVLTVPPERSVLEVIEEAGVTVLSSCTEGDVRDVRDHRAGRGAGAPRLAAQRRRACGKRHHVHLRLPVLQPAAGARTLR